MNYLCIHGHFYQPPRENPWLEAIERQDSAYPFHDWNERVTAESYAPNAVSRILDDDGRIRELANNYERISFNFGPTLLHWMETHAPETYEAILEADRRSIDRFSGHGSALAQVYNHLIMPLANDRDRRTQVIWGVRDFEHRFGRKPEGMWLAETAANVASLEALAEQGIAYTILAPGQAGSVRPLPDGAGPGQHGEGSEDGVDPAAAPGAGAESTEAPGSDSDSHSESGSDSASDAESGSHSGTGSGAHPGSESQLDDGGEWRDVSGGRVDPTRPYLCRLPSGREIVVFFYDGPLSRAVAFEGLLRSGDKFAGRLTDVFSDDRDWPQLGHIATDGETYGHHHRHGDMALARALRVIEERDDIALTNYGEYLERHPPTWEARIVDDTSWSCVHGVERWRSNCGCATGGKPEWTQAWREPLRNALDALRDDLAPRYEREAGKLVKDPWAARDDYIDVILDREPEVIDAFLDRHAVRDLDAAERVRLTKLLELQRQAQLMYTSCGWFFDELSGIETVQVMRYAGRAIQLAEELFDAEIEAPFLEALGEARSNLPSQGDGRAIYDRTVRDARVDLLEVGAHFAISSLFEDTGAQTREYCYDIAVSDSDVREAGRARLATGHITVTSRVTKEVEELSYGVLHLGDHTIHAGVRRFQEEAAFEGMRADVNAPFEAADFTDAIRAVDQHFEGSTYNLRSLFQDQRRQVLDLIIQSTLRDAESQYRQIYERNAPLMRFLHDLSTPMPAALSLAGEYVLNTELVREVSDSEMDLDRVRSLLEDAQRREIMLDTDGLGFAYTRTLEELAAQLREDPHDVGLVERLRDAVRLVEEAPFGVNLWTVQNDVYDVWRDHGTQLRERAESDESSARWLDVFAELAAEVEVAVE